jgi:hypothetical protein
MRHLAEKMQAINKDNFNNQVPIFIPDWCTTPRMGTEQAWLPATLTGFRFPGGLQAKPESTVVHATSTSRRFTLAKESNPRKRC